MCCEGCEDKLKGSPATYLAKLAPAPAPENEVLSVPESAVIDTGTKKVVFVEMEPGVFEGREVVLGPRSGDVYPVLDGLSPGEKVAAAGSFLLDAETRLKGSSGPAPAAPSATPEPKSMATRPAAEPSASGHRH
jgi:Cu(I)/Ag(I) efflux system membrane fusion protein